MKLINKTLVSYFNWQIGRVEAWKNHPLSKQKKTFHYLIDKAKNTQWGQLHHYHQIKEISDFQAGVPIQSYDTLKAPIHQMIAGEKNVLWTGKTTWFAQSSGTTSDRSKLIPVSREAMQLGHYKGGADLLSLYCHHFPTTRIFEGKGLVIGGSHAIHQLHSKAHYGDLSAVLLQNMSWLGRRLRTPKLAIALMDEWEAKIELLAQTCIKQNITYFVGVPTWNLVLFKRIFELTGKQQLQDIWPNLELYIHGGVSFTPYMQQFEQLSQVRPLQYWQTYNASEGFFGMQDLPNRDDMLLMVDHGVFYEFLPLENIGNPNAKTLTLKEVKKGIPYALIISTNAGLWRYLIGDTIQFTSLYPFRIKIIGRTKHFINAFGEELIIDNADRAVARACSQTGAKIVEYTVAPIYFGNDSTNDLAGKGGHEWLIEFEQMPDNLAHFTNCLDKHLQAVNSDYAAKRYKNLAMGLPLVQVTPKNTFYLWLEKKGKLGGQHKVPRLSNNRSTLEEIKQFIKLNL